MQSEARIHHQNRALLSFTCQLGAPFFCALRLLLFGLDKYALQRSLFVTNKKSIKDFFVKLVSILPSDCFCLSFTNVQCLVFAKKCLSLAKFCKNIVVCFVNLLAHFIANINMFEILPAVTDFKRTKLSSNVRQKRKLQNYFLPRSSNLSWNFSAHMCENVILII